MDQNVEVRGSGRREMERLLLRVEEVAEVLALSRSTVAAMISRGEIESIRIGRARRVSLDQLKLWIADQGR